MAGIAIKIELDNGNLHEAFDKAKRVLAESNVTSFLNNPKITLVVSGE